MPRSRFDNCFDHFRGPGSGREAAINRQLEDNATKAVINVLTHSEPGLTKSFLTDVACVSERAEEGGPFEYFLQGGPEFPARRRLLLGISLLGEIDPKSWAAASVQNQGSRVDAAIHSGNVTVLIETKVVELLDASQLQRHAERWNLDVPSEAPSEAGRLPDTWRIAAWPDVYRWARDELGRDHNEPTNFLLGQLVEYLELAGLAPAWSFREEHFDHFATERNERDPLVASEIQKRMSTIWSRVADSLGDEAFQEALGEARVGSMKQDHAFAQSNDEMGSHYVNLTIELWEGEFNINVVGGFDRQVEAMRNWLSGPDGREFVEKHPRHELVIFVRKAKPNKSPAGFDWRARMVTKQEVERIRLGQDRYDRVIAAIADQEASLSGNGQKLGLDLRRAWQRDDAAEIDDLAGPISEEIEQLIPALEQIRSGS